MNNIIDLDSSYILLYNCLTYIPTDLIKIIIYDYLDYRIKCEGCCIKLNDYDLTSCTVCTINNILYCTTCRQLKIYYSFRCNSCLFIKYGCPVGATGFTGPTGSNNYSYISHSLSTKSFHKINKNNYKYIKKY